MAWAIQIGFRPAEFRSSRARGAFAASFANVVRYPQFCAAPARTDHSLRVQVSPTELEDVVVAKTGVFPDDRGFFMEVFRADEFGAAGLPTSFVQLNHSRSTRGVIRGLHFQWDPPVGKMMRVTRGSALVVAVDIRPGSPTLGKHVARELSEENMLQMWAPAGFARGFCALSDIVEVQYLCTGIYNPACESGILYSDERIGIRWPVAQPQVSAKDARAQTLDEWLARPEARFLMKL
jgi:dTDP-4-dehydrorhamnose 3,5-epimerase